MVSLREVSSSEKLLLCRSLLKENIKFWQEYLAGSSSNDHMQALKKELDFISVSIQEAILKPESEEVYYSSFGFIAKKMTEKTKRSISAELICGSEIKKTLILICFLVVASS